MTYWLRFAKSTGSFRSTVSIRYYYHHLYYLLVTLPRDLTRPVFCTKRNVSVTPLLTFVRSRRRGCGDVENGFCFPHLHAPVASARWLAVPVACTPAPSAAAPCTTEARNTHKTALREITYLWHPWHGQRVLVRGEARRGGSFVLQCVRDELKGFPTLEIPEWMFNANLCGRMKPAETPRVDCAALLALKHLLAAATECSQQDMVQAQHDSSSSGDADAQAVSAHKPSRRVVFSSSEAPRVARGSAAEDGPTLGQDVERTLAPALRGHDTGGGR